MGERSQHGTRVVVAGSGTEPEHAIAQAFRAAGSRVAPVALDVTAVEEVAESLGGMDVLVLVTPPSDPQPFLQRSRESWTSTVAERVTTPLQVLALAATRMARDHGGSIVVVGTLDATHAYAGRADAAVGIAALLGAVRSMAVELAPAGIRANAVTAGPLEARATDANEPGRDRTLQRSPSGRFVTPDEVAAAVLFVAGERAGFMTGATLRVDAGWASLNQAPDGMRFA